MATALETIKSQNFLEITKLFARPKFKTPPVDAIKQYKVMDHDIFDRIKRPMQEVAVKSKTQVDTNGDPTTVTKYVDVVRVGIPWQQIITERRIGFMLSDPVTMNVIWDTESEKEKALVKLVKRILHDNKMDYLNKEILRRKLSECEVGVIWYYVDQGESEVPRFTLKCKIISPELGDTLYPLFDAYGNLISFRRDYEMVEDDNRVVMHSDIYTDEFQYKYINKGGWNIDDSVSPNPIPNTAKKMFLEYYYQPEPVWAKEQSMIDRHEELSSNHGDMNNKFGAPIFVIAGEFSSEVDNNKTGSILQLENGATADYAQLSSEPASIKLEQEHLERFIYAMSQTPNITFSEMKGIGNVTGIALKMLFLDAHMAVNTEEETFGIGLQRRLNIIKAAIGALIDVSLVAEAKAVQLIPVIVPYLPQNVSEMITDLTVAVTGGILSKETAIEENPLVEDSKIEMERMRNDATAQLADVQLMQSKIKQPVNLPGQ